MAVWGICCLRFKLALSTQLNNQVSYNNKEAMEGTYQTQCGGCHNGHEHRQCLSQERLKHTLKQWNAEGEVEVFRAVHQLAAGIQHARTTRTGLANPCCCSDAASALKCGVAVAKCNRGLLGKKQWVIGPSCMPWHQPGCCVRGGARVPTGGTQGRPMQADVHCLAGGANWWGDACTSLLSMHSCDNNCTGAVIVRNKPSCLGPVSYRHPTLLLLLQTSLVPRLPCCYAHSWRCCCCAVVLDGDRRPQAGSCVFSHLAVEVHLVRLNHHQVGNLVDRSGKLCVVRGGGGHKKKVSEYWWCAGSFVYPAGL